MHIAMDIDDEISVDVNTNDALNSKADIQQESIPTPVAAKETIAFFPDQGTDDTATKWNPWCLIFLKHKQESS